jgi:hypothetical protein
MNKYFELGLESYSVFPDGMIIISFSDSEGFGYISEIELDQDCKKYESEIINNLRKYIVYYCAHFGGQSLIGKKMIFDLAEPNGNIFRIV